MGIELPGMAYYQIETGSNRNHRSRNIRVRYLSQCIVEQRKLRQVCANAQTRQSLRCLHNQSMDVDGDSEQNYDI